MEVIMEYLALVLFILFWAVVIYVGRNIYLSINVNTKEYPAPEMPEWYFKLVMNRVRDPLTDPTQISQLEKFHIDQFKWLISMARKGTPVSIQSLMDDYDNPSGPGCYLLGKAKFRNTLIIAFKQTGFTIDELGKLHSKFGGLSVNDALDAELNARK